MSENAPVVVRLSEVADIAAAVPHLLGFEPSESIVAISLRGRRMRIAFTVRLDLPTSPKTFDDVVRISTEAMVRDGARAVLLVVFTTELPGDRGLPYADLVDAVEADLKAPVRDAVLVADGRVWSYRCDDPLCCPAEGTSLNRATPGALALSAATALAGRAVLSDRASVVATVAPVRGITEQSMEQAISRAFALCADLGVEAYRALARATLADLRARYAEPPAALTHEEAARLVVGLHDIELRDDVLMDRDRDEEVLRRVFADLARLALPPVDAPVCTLLACFAYLGGSGVVAAAALDRALASDPSYGLARLIDCALTGQLHPRELRQALSRRD